MTEPLLYRVWDLGQRHLVAGRYSAARAALEAAESLAWRRHDAASLGRLYLSLLEARRQMRLLAVEGRLVLMPAPGAALPGGALGSRGRQRRELRDLIRQHQGVLLLSTGPGSPVDAACRLAGSLQYATRRRSAGGAEPAMEALLLLHHSGETRLASPADPTFAAGIPVQWTTDPAAAVGPATDDDLVAPLPPPGVYQGSAPGPGALARETLLTAWEALALNWQRRHPLGPCDPWEEMAWLRLALRIDPACEPITMRLIALCQGIVRAGRE